MSQSLNVGVSGAWKSAKPFVGVSGAWKAVQAGWVGVGGVWKQFYTAVLGVVVPGGNWTIFGDGTWFGEFTVIVTGGTAPYTYRWTNTGTTTPVLGTGPTYGMGSQIPYSYTPVTLDCLVTDANGVSGLGTGTFS